eukprot:6136295-Alexandrium_andersonii.AAC.1
MAVVVTSPQAGLARTHAEAITQEPVDSPGRGRTRHVALHVGGRSTWRWTTTERKQPRWEP